MPVKKHSCKKRTIPEDIEASISQKDCNNNNNENMCNNNNNDCINISSKTENEVLSQDNKSPDLKSDVKAQADDNKNITPQDQEYEMASRVSHNILSKPGEENVSRDMKNEETVSEDKKTEKNGEIISQGSDHNMITQNIMSPKEPASAAAAAAAAATTTTTTTSTSEADNATSGILTESKKENIAGVLT
uniref:Uncharacterized protein n=1 Tax=Penaeus monodon majanivirus B TaxID=2984272 RepID=A0A9C7BV52_9VIRU|nr:MAG: hypothetical protein [Penaeus monodon majanivirus B]